MVYTIVVHLYAKEGKEVEEKLRNKLIEASQVYSKDKETIGWHVMQDHQDPRKWCIVERYEHESVRVPLQRHLLINTPAVSCGCPASSVGTMLTEYCLVALAEPEVSPGEPLLEDLRPLRHPAFGQGDGPPPLPRAGYQQAGQG